MTKIRSCLLLFAVAVPVVAVTTSALADPPPDPAPAAAGGAAPAVPAADLAKLTQTIQDDCGDPIGQYTTDTYLSSYKKQTVREDYAEAMMKYCTHCQDAVAAAVTAGMPASTIVDVKERKLPLTEIKADADAMYDLATRSYWRSHVYQEVARARGFYEKISTTPEKEITGVQLEVALGNADDCNKAVTAALKAGAPPDTIIDDEKGTILLLSEAKAKVCTPCEKVAAPLVAKRQAEEDKKFAPFTKLLSGDKLKIFNDNFRFGTYIFGPGGRSMTKPAEFVKAARWYTTGVNSTRHAWPVWELDIFKFNGMKLAGTDHKSGIGPSVPSAQMP